ncbi:cell envelope biogenesis protein OmpA [Scandinavium goeteborgense]|uniref:cell envelope biogenesis protein OmpA n=1 Tax=Scandinavium goeteborgense TaxID=1851514 RepID=UPI000F686837|nr:cell envelope biogenesis protein OmpA [Scandinavium goeteborgense]QKN80776.1 cell envelope biogenesis protein OmpA [Scandinavium goeteborgense]
MKNALKAVLGITLVSLSVSSFAQQYEDYPEVPGVGLAYATSGEFFPGPGTIVTSPDNALGVPDDNAVPLGDGGTLILGFDPFVITGDKTSAPDFSIIEQSEREIFSVFISADKENWIEVKPVYKEYNSAGSTYGFDVDAVEGQENQYKYVKLVDASFSAGSSYAGADIVGAVVTSGKYVGGGVVVDTDSRNGIVYNLEKDKSSGVVDVKKIGKDGSVQHIMFSDDDSLDPIALSVQGNFDCDDAKDINVLATRKADDVPVNIIKDQQGNDIATIDNSVTN